MLQDVRASCAVANRRRLPLAAAVAVRSAQVARWRAVPDTQRQRDCPHDAYEKHCGRRVKTMHEIGEWQWRRVTGHPFGHAAGTTGDDLIRVVVMYQAACGSL